MINKRNTNKNTKRKLIQHCQEVQLLVKKINDDNHYHQQQHQQHFFECDAVLGANVSQKEVCYYTVNNSNNSNNDNDNVSIVNTLLNSINIRMIEHGQIDSGKTFTIDGSNENDKGIMHQGGVFFSPLKSPSKNQ